MGGVCHGCPRFFAAKPATLHKSIGSFTVPSSGRCTAAVCLWKAFVLRWHRTDFSKRHMSCRSGNETGKADVYSICGAAHSAVRTLTRSQESDPQLSESRAVRSRVSRKVGTAVRLLVAEGKLAFTIFLCPQVPANTDGIAAASGTKQVLLHCSVCAVLRANLCGEARRCRRIAICRKRCQLKSKPRQFVSDVVGWSLTHARQSLAFVGGGNIEMRMPGHNEGLLTDSHRLSGRGGKRGACLQLARDEVPAKQQDARVGCLSATC